MSFDRDEAIRTLQDLTAGTLGACAGIVAGQPLDTIKIRLQVNRGQYRSALDCVASVVRREGPLALYKGMLSPLLGNAPLNMIVFGTYGNMRRTLDRYWPDAPPVSGQSLEPNYWKLYAAGTYAGAAQCVVCTPVELVKCRMQIQENAVKLMRKSAVATTTQAGELNVALHTQALYRGSVDCARQIYRSYGLRGLYRGWWAEFWRDAPSYGFWFVAYEYVKYHLTPPDQKSPTTSTLLLAGSAAGIATWVVTYPFDVIKSVIQAAPDSTPPAQLKIGYVARTHYERYGMRWFWTGIGTTLVRAVPVSAVTFLVYDRLLSYMSGSDDHSDHGHDSDTLHAQ